MKPSARPALSAAVVALALVVFAGIALADNGPHDASALSNADMCAACHRTHTAQAPNLLTAGPNQDDFCFSCHDGSGAYTDVLNGELEAGSTFGVGDDLDGNPLRGGGFVFAMMDPDRDGIVSSGTVTSTHNADGQTVGTIWGSGTVSAAADVGKAHSLECGDCHNPHGNGNYRILRGNPDGMEQEGIRTAVQVADPGTTTYEIGFDADNFRDVSGYSPDLGRWCTQCHTRYWATSDSGETGSGDAVFAYQHMTDGLTGTCFSCHVAHGTSAIMGAYSGAAALPDGTGDAVHFENSRLLSANNRLVCLQCHDVGTLPD